VRQFETQLAGIRKSLRDVASPDNTLILSFDSHFLGYRHAGYYLPDYWTVQYPEVALPAGLRVFAMRRNQTHLLSRLPVEQYENFVVFPLPEGASFREYLQKLRARFPERGLRVEMAGGREFLMGKTADLPVLFPSAAARPPQVSTPGYSSP
jgi:hypothetical protein